MRADLRDEFIARAVQNAIAKDMMADDDPAIVEYARVVLALPVERLLEEVEL